MLKKEKDIFKPRKPSNFVSKILILLVLMCIIAAMTEIRLHPKQYNTSNVTEIPFHY